MMNQGEHLQKGRCFSFIFERVCALVRGAERSCSRARVSLSGRARWWRGLSFFFRSNGLRSARARGREGCFDSPQKNIAKPYKMV